MYVTIWLSLLFALLHPVLTEPNIVHQYDHSPVSDNVFESLEELARIVDITYCVGSTGIVRPFQCLSRCSDFKGFELVTTWNTGPLLSDSCGYIALSHEPFEKRVIVAFRGTYSIANTIADLSTRRAEFVPFPTGGDDYNNDCIHFLAQSTSVSSKQQVLKPTAKESECENCTIHSGFLTSWQNTRCIVLPHIEEALADHPGYKLVLVGHSLGGAVAAVAALELQARGHQPYVTTFGEPRIGNKELNQHINRKFSLNTSTPDKSRFRRVTHVDDPVPLLPLEEWGYEMHSGEIFISKLSLAPGRKDVHACTGDSDPSCIAGNGEALETTETEKVPIDHDVVDSNFPNDYNLGQLFFAHRDYFWRLGLCVPSVLDPLPEAADLDLYFGSLENTDTLENLESESYLAE